MGEQHDFLVRPSSVGHWEGKTFVFDEEHEIMVDGEKIILRRLDTEGMVAEDGITADDVISAILNPAFVDGIHADE